MNEVAAVKQRTWLRQTGKLLGVGIGLVVLIGVLAFGVGLSGDGMRIAGLLGGVALIAATFHLFQGLSFLKGLAAYLIVQFSMLFITVLINVLMRGVLQ